MSLQGASPTFLRVSFNSGLKYLRSKPESSLKSVRNNLNTGFDRSKSKGTLKSLRGKSGILFFLLFSMNMLVKFNKWTTHVLEYGFNEQFKKNIDYRLYSHCCGNKKSEILYAYRKNRSFLNTCLMLAITPKHNSFITNHNIFLMT